MKKEACCTPYLIRDSPATTTRRLTMQKPPGASRTASPEPYVVQPTSAHTHTFILLHGLGSNGEKFGVELLESGISSTRAKFTEIFPGGKIHLPDLQKASIQRLSSSNNKSVVRHCFP